MTWAHPIIGWERGTTGDCQPVAWLVRWGRLVPPARCRAVVGISEGHAGCGLRCTQIWREHGAAPATRTRIASVGCWDADLPSILVQDGYGKHVELLSASGLGHVQQRLCCCLRCRSDPGVIAVSRDSVRSKEDKVVEQRQEMATSTNQTSVRSATRACPAAAPGGACASPPLGVRCHVVGGRERQGAAGPGAAVAGRARLRQVQGRA